MKVEVKSLNGVFVLWFIMLQPHPVISLSREARADERIKFSVIRSWAEKLGVELWHAGDYITRRKLVQDSFKQAQVMPRSGQKIAEEMARDILYMMESRISAVKRIMDAAENMAMSHDQEDTDPAFSYYNAKEMIEPGEAITSPNLFDMDEHDAEELAIEVPAKQIVLLPDPHFFNERVNKSHSAVHVPTNVYDRSVEVISAIEWSEKLDSIFRDNYNNDPSLSWQFFASSTGFMRQFPAAKWAQDPVDLYDARLRPWYIEAATGSKDIVVLVDTSGSMTGQRRDIAKHVVNNILDTLGSNDFVNIYKFDINATTVVDCFNETLVQANMANIRELKLGMDDMETNDIANVTAALVKAFELLKVYRDSKRGACCNQAIMLIADGVPYNYQEIFEAYNLDKHVRVFTYLIGREVADVKEIKWMACENRGFYVHLSTMAEVREQVLNYIPVMARPLVLNRTFHPIMWSQVYADVIDPKMTDWSWEVKEREEQRERSKTYLQNRSYFQTNGEQERRFQLIQKQTHAQATDSSQFHFMTTVSMPVFDRRENATKIANLLGVAGTDVPIAELKKLMMPYMLGVNGYAFIVTNNGYVLVHPDLRPVFQDILKPSYNAVDMVEVELMDDDQDPREFNDKLLDMRDAIINQTNGSKWMFVKYHLDSMKRVSRITRKYYWTPIKDTTFTLVVTFPESYGVNRIQPRIEDEIHRLLAQGHNLTEFFSGNHWSVHPDWMYCKSKYRSYNNPETELKDILKTMSKPGWKWPLNRLPLPPEHAANLHFSNSSMGRPPKTEKDQYYCDRNLMISLVYDAKVTSWWNATHNNKEDKGNEFKQRFGVTVAFMATHSGLTRWQEFYSNSVEETRSEQDFSENNKRAVDEVWYKRAVEQYFVEPSSFVYSVPFDAADYIQNTLITASHAIFHADGGKKAPAAVVGFQFRHAALVTLFRNITSQCMDAPCTHTCSSEDFHCFILDNHGYVVYSPDMKDTGRFFGEVRGWVMSRLVADNIFKEVKMFDYQAVCFALRDTINAGPILQLPFKHFLHLVQWVGRLVVFMLVQLSILAVDANSAYNYANEDISAQYFEQDDPSYYQQPTEMTGSPSSKAKEQDFDRRVLINKTRPQTCDQVMTLYQLNTEKTVFQKTFDACDRPFVVIPVANSNLILLVVDALCGTHGNPAYMTTAPEEWDYNQSIACYKTSQMLPRRRPTHCISTHEREHTIELCGRGARTSNSCSTLGLCCLLILIVFGYRHGGGGGGGFH